MQSPFPSVARDHRDIYSRCVTQLLVAALIAKASKTGSTAALTVATEVGMDVLLQWSGYANHLQVPNEEP